MWSRKERKDLHWGEWILKLKKDEEKEIKSSLFHEIYQGDLTQGRRERKSLENAERVGEENGEKIFPPLLA